MINDRPMTLRELAMMIQRSIATAKAAEAAKSPTWKSAKHFPESIYETRDKIRKANDF